MSAAPARSWFAEVRERDVAAIAVAAGLKFKGRRFGPCPVCKVAGTGRRPPLALGPSGFWWRCYACGAGKDGVALAAACATGATRPVTWASVRAWAAARGLCAAAAETRETDRATEAAL